MKMFSEAKCSCGKHQHHHRHLLKRWKIKNLSSRKQVSNGRSEFPHRLIFLSQMKLPTKIFIHSEVIYLPQAIKLTIRIDNDE